LWSYAKLEFRKSGIGQFCAKSLLRMIAQIVVFFSRKTDAQRKKNLRFVPQKLRKSFANGNPTSSLTLLLMYIYRNSNK